MPPLSHDDLATQFDTSWDGILDTWKICTEFPSIGSNPNHTDDCRRCAEWFADRLETLGVVTDLLPTAGHPVVWAERRGREGSPTVLFYGHYDVQPVDPLDAWTTPPFKPDYRDGRLYARGAQDNKGQCLYVIEAIAALIERDALDATVRIVIEGEEECGSKGITAALPDWHDRLQADILMVADTLTVRSGAPTITMGLRGLALVDLALRTAAYDLHSGMHGGVAPNAATAAARIVASLHDTTGRIAVDGFYDGVVPPTPREHELANRTPFDADAYRTATGAVPIGGERDLDPAERIGFRPALDVNGLHAGHAGPGAKTIIPAEAALKLSARLAAGQDAQACVDAIVRHLETHVPDGVELTITDKLAAGPALRVSPASPVIAAATAALETLDDRSTTYLWEGASIPIVSSLAAISGAEPLLVGFGHEDDRIHAPDESFSREQFRRGFLYAGLFLSRL